MLFVEAMISLSLALLKTRILLVDHIQFAFPPHDLAIGTSFLDGCSYFHDLLFVPEYDSSPRQIIWAHFNSYLITRQNSDVVHSHFS